MKRKFVYFSKTGQNVLCTVSGYRYFELFFSKFSRLPGTPSSKSRGKNKLAELPPPPEHMLTTSGRQDSQEEELEERNRTLVPGKFPGSSGGDASGAHRARFPGTVKRGLFYFCLEEKYLLL